VSGVDAASLDKVESFFDRIVQHTVVVSSPREAELAKPLENTFRHVNIALVNEFAVFANESSTLTSGRPSMPPPRSRSAS
jgi:UDP-N-acetyl-D-mannosaminuronate dehydrogenase